MIPGQTIKALIVIVQVCSNKKLFRLKGFWFKSRSENQLAQVQVDNDEVGSRSRLVQNHQNCLGMKSVANRVEQKRTVQE